MYQAFFVMMVVTLRTTVVYPGYAHDATGADGGNPVPSNSLRVDVVADPVIGCLVGTAAIVFMLSLGQCQLFLHYCVTSRQQRFLDGGTDANGKGGTTRTISEHIMDHQSNTYAPPTPDVDMAVDMAAAAAAAADHHVSGGGSGAGVAGLGGKQGRLMNTPVTKLGRAARILAESKAEHFMDSPSESCMGAMVTPLSPENSMMGGGEGGQGGGETKGEEFTLGEAKEEAAAAAAGHEEVSAFLGPSLQEELLDFLPHAYPSRETSFADPGYGHNDTTILLPGGGGREGLHTTTIVVMPFDVLRQSVPLAPFLVALMAIGAALFCFLQSCVWDIITLRMEGIAGIVENSTLIANPSFGVVKRLRLIDSVPQLALNTADAYKGTSDVVASCYVGFVVVAPLLLLMSWSFLWISSCPKRCRPRRRCGLKTLQRRCCGGEAGRGCALRFARDVCPFLFACVSLDVVLVSAVASAFEMNTAVSWIVQEDFQALCDALANWGYPCIQISGHLQPGWFWLATTVSLFGFLFVHTWFYFGLPGILPPLRGGGGEIALTFRR